MKFAAVLLICFVAKVSAGTIKHPHGNSMNLMWLTTNHSIVVDYDGIEGIFNHTDLANRKVVAVSVIGALRKGKSFLMDYCLRFMYANYKSVNFPTNPLDNKDKWIGAPEEPLAGFSWKGGAERHTTGVIMWSDVFLYEQGGEKYAIILLDTQGLFDAKTSAADNSRIFALGTLISSIQIFNLNDVIQENQIEYLQMATNYAQFHGNVTAGNQAIKPFQNILFLMRDWAHPHDFPFGRAGGDAYIESYLSTETDGRNPALKNVRDHIKNSFDKINGFLLPHPGAAVTAHGYDGQHSAMNENFRTNLIAFIEWLLGPQNLVKKRILEHEVEGFEYGQYMKRFFEIFQSPNTPKTDSIYEATVNQQLGNAVAYAMKQYVAGLTQFTDFNRADFVKDIDTIHSRAEELTLSWFKASKKMGTKADEDKFHTRLQDEMKEYFTQYKKTSIETWETMERERVENAEKLDRMEKDNEAKLEAERKAQEEQINNLNSEYQSKISDIQNAADLTAAQKQDQIDALTKEKENQEQNLQASMDTMRAELEAEKNSTLSGYQKKIKDLEGQQKSKSSVIVDAINSGRDLFMDMMKQQAEAAEANRRDQQQRYELEDKRRQDEMQLLREKNELDAQMRLKELERQDEIRREDKEREEKRYEMALADRKLEAEERREERRADQERYQQQMEQMRADMLARSGAFMMVSSVWTLCGLLMSAVLIKKFLQ